LPIRSFLQHRPSLSPLVFLNPQRKMPVFTEHSTSSRDLRVARSFAPPLPRLTPKFEPSGAEEKYEVVIAGVSRVQKLYHSING